MGDYTGYYEVDVESTNAILNRNAKTLEGLDSIRGVRAISISDFWKLKADIVIPAAMELQVNQTVAESFHPDCKLVAEGANGPLDTDADRLLTERNIPVIPDVLCNSGGVIVSYFEWLQNRTNEYWSLQQVEMKLKELLRTTFFKFKYMYDDTNTTNASQHLPNRDIVYKMALDNLWNSYEIKK
ncbi:MAG: hypothetical protein EBV23_13740 [Flavobacteriia bacterium]|nr:hypothetical protein [Flavobacteriia bacterium]